MSLPEPASDLAPGKHLVHRWRRAVAVVLKLLVSALLIWLALRGVDFASVRGHLGAADPVIVLLAAGIATAIALVHAERWNLILRDLSHRVAYATTLRFVLIGYFFNQTLPSTVGGDGFRIWGIYRRGIPGEDAVSSVVLDRVLALESLLLMILGGLPWLFELVTRPVARWIVLAIIAAGALALGMLLLVAHFKYLLGRWRITRLVLALSLAARRVFSNAGGVAWIVILTIASYALASLVVHLLARSLAVELPLRQALLLIPLVTLVSVLPISIAGWGLRESAMVVALGLIGVPAAAAFSLSVLYGLVTMATGIPGGMLWLLARHRHTALEPDRA